MPIPHFDQFGNLSVGDLFSRAGANHSLTVTTLHEIHARFVRALSARRAQIWNGWMRHRQRLDQLPVPYITLVDGSYLTQKADPNDVDVCILFDARVADGLQGAAAAEFRTSMDRDRARREHSLDLYLLPVYPFEDSRFLTTLGRFTYWTRVFGIDRLGRQKGILAVPGGGVL